MKHLLFCWLLLQVFPLSAQNLPIHPTYTDTLYLDSMSLQIGTLFEQGNYEALVSVAQVGLPQVEKRFGRDNPEYGAWLDIIGVGLNHAGRLEEALPYLQQGTEHARLHLGEGDDYITRLSNLGMLYKDLEEYGQALNTLEECVAKGESVLKGDPETYGVLVNNLALAYEEVGELSQALKFYQQALLLTEKSVGKDHVRYATRLQNIASVYRQSGQYDQALGLYQEALRIREKHLGKEHPQVIYVLANIGRTYRDLKNYDRALQMAQEAETMAAKTLGRLHTTYPLYLTEVAMCYRLVGKLQEAQATFVEAESLVAQIAGNSELWNKSGLLYQERAFLEDQMGNYATAADYYVRLADQSIRKIQNQFDQLNQADRESYLAQLTTDIQNMLGFAFRHPEHTALIGKVFDMTLVMKGMTLDYRRRLLNFLRHNADTLTTQDFREWENLEKKLAVQYSLPASKQLPERPKLEYRAQELERQLANSSVAFREARQLVSWKDVQNALQDQEAAVEFYTFRYRVHQQLTDNVADSTLYVAFVLRKHDTQPRMIRLFMAEQLTNLRAIRSLYSMPDAAGGTTLHELIWKSLSPALAGVSTIFYAPTGLLNRVNFGAIPFDQQHTLSQQYHLYQLGSTRQLALEDRKIQSSPALSAGIFGGIDYDAANVAPTNPTSVKQNAGVKQPGQESTRDIPMGNGDAWTYLTWTEREAEDVGTFLHSAGAKVEMFRGAAATEEEFKQMCSGDHTPSVVHLATHGFFFPDRDAQAATGFSAAEDPMVRSGLILAGANRAWQGQPPLPGREDGILTAYEISLLNFRHTDLVVLSACDTGLGELKGNDGVYGLQRAFKIAGARYILMSLWQTSDRLTHAFMNLFYREWLVNKKDIPRAFQAAQNQLQQEYRIPYNPSVWAGFILVE